MDLKKTLATDSVEELLKAVCVKRKNEDDIKQYLQDYKGEHKILQKPNKKIGDGTTARYVKLNKLVIPHQKKIVRIASVFLVGEPVQYQLELDEAEKGPYQDVMDVFDDNKMVYFDRKLVRTIMSETFAAELWYAKKKPGKEKEYRVQLLAHSLGDELYPLFDEYGDLIAFTRRYSIPGEDGKPEEHADIYTDDVNVFMRKPQGGGWERKDEKNLFGKIPVIYYEKDVPEWADVQRLIERDESQLSKLSDVVDYYADPVLKLKGKVKDPVGADGSEDTKGKRYDFKEEAGKVIQFEGEPGATGKTEYGDAEYLEPNAYPDLRDLERKAVKEYIYSQTSTPDISFNNVKGIGNLSGVTIKMLFLDAVFKAKESEEIYGEGFRRRFNLVASMLKNTNVKQTYPDMRVDIVFQSPLPADIHELVESLSVASGGEAIMSKKTAVRNNPLVQDPEQEIEELEKEEVSDLGESYNIGGPNE